MNKKFQIGSETAKAGFRNENDVIEKFNNWEEYLFVQEWLKKLGHNLSQIQDLKASKITSNFKADIQVNLTEKFLHFQNNIQVKLIRDKRGYNIR